MNNKHKVDWKGNFCAVVTPFNKDGSIDENAFCENLELLISEGIDGLVVAGCTGEFWSLTFEEKIRLFELSVNKVNGRVPIISGCMGSIIDEIVNLSNTAINIGVDGVLLTPPLIAIPNLHEIKNFYEHISRNVEGSIVVYNVPRRQGINMPPEFLDSLKTLNNIVAIKQSNPDFNELINLIHLSRQHLKIFIGHSAVRGFPGLVMGGHGFVSSSEPQILGEDAINIYNYAIKGDFENARKNQEKCLSLSRVLELFGTASLKGAMNIMGRPGGYPRPPLLPLTEEEKSEVRKRFKDLKLL